MFGLLNIDKPSGFTSRAIVNKVERLVKPYKVGHSGTLDPLATGVLVLGVGTATRLLEYVQQMPKTYHARFCLGQSSETDDIEGKVVAVDGAPVPTVAAVRQCLRKFSGLILQRPPQYSAIKVQGRRAYDLARSGKCVKLTPREVTIYALELIRYDYPEIELEVKCSGGTYIRAIGRDLAEGLKTSAVMSSLCRTAVGRFKKTQSVSLGDLQGNLVVNSLLPPQLAVADLSPLALSRDQAEAVSHGRTILLESSQTPQISSEQAAAFCESDLVAILRREGPFTWTPHKVFSPGIFTNSASSRL